MDIDTPIEWLENKPFKSKAKKYTKRPSLESVKALFYKTKENHYTRCRIIIHKNILDKSNLTQKVKILINSENPRKLLIKPCDIEDGGYKLSEVKKSYCNVLNVTIHAVPLVLSEDDFITKKVFFEITKEGLVIDLDREVNK